MLALIVFMHIQGFPMMSVETMPAATCEAIQASMLRDPDVSTAMCTDDPAFILQMTKQHNCRIFEVRDTWMNALCDSTPSDYRIK